MLFHKDPREEEEVKEEEEKEEEVEEEEEEGEEEEKGIFSRHVQARDFTQIFASTEQR